MNCLKISESLEKYYQNRSLQEELDGSLLLPKNKEEWQSTFYNRAIQLEQLFVQNEQLKKELFNELNEPFSAESALFLYQEMKQTYSYLNKDWVIEIPILKKLLAYYEKHYDPSIMARIYGFLISNLGNMSDGLQQQEIFFQQQCARKMIAMRKEYNQMLDSRARLDVFMGYYAICVVEQSKKLISVDDSFLFLEQMLDFWNLVNQEDDKNNQLEWFVKLIQKEWLSVQQNIDTANPKAIALFCKLADFFYQEELKNKDWTYHINCNVCAAYYHSLVLRGKLNWNEAIQQFFMYYIEYIKHLDEQEYYSNHGVVLAGLPVEEANFLLNAPFILEDWLKHCTDVLLTEEIMNQLKKSTIVFYQQFSHNFQSNISISLTKWCFTMLPHLTGMKEKEEWIIKLVISRQFSTYLHSVMVKKLALTLGDALVRMKPELFYEVYKKIPKQNILEYISRCALFHDLGKNVIADIVNLQVRSLDELEYAEIRKHPLYGYQMVCKDDDFKIYLDIILGHHKYYNGQGGYPLDFDNTASPYRFVIDLITICDCLDAATDTLGRNYKHSKSFEDVLEELKRDQGIKYNPMIVEFIFESKVLQKRLLEIVTEERLNTAYEIYSIMRKKEQNQEEEFYHTSVGIPIK